MQVSGSAQHPPVGVFENTYHGNGHTVEVSYRTKPSVGQLAFTQNIPMRGFRAALAAELGHAFDAKATSLSYAGRMRRVGEPNETFGFSLQTWAYGILHYSRVFAPEQAGANQMTGIAHGSTVTLGTDFHYNMADHMALVSGAIGMCV